MKKRYWGIALVLVILTLSCVLGTGGSENGSIGMNFALTPGQKSLTEGSDRVRVWVYSNNVLLANTAGGTDYYAAPLTGALTIEELPPGDAYRIVVAAGKLDGTVFTATNFGASPIFSIKAGFETAADLELQDITITANLNQKGLKSAVVIGGNIFAVSSSAAYIGTAADTLVSYPIPALAGKSFNSLAVGNPFTTPFLIVNTNAGLFNNVGTAFASFSGTAPNILQSSAFGGVFFYQSEKELGAWTGGAEWTRIPLDIEKLNGRPIVDFFVTQPTAGGGIYGFFATRIVGSFRMAETFISGNAGKDGDYFVQEILGKNSLLNFFGEDVPFINGFGYTSPANGHILYVATKNGLYKTKAGFGDDAFDGTPVLVPGTKGLDLRKVVTSSNANGALIAAITEKNVVVIKTVANVPYVFRLPFLASTLGVLSDIAWNGTKLVVTGTNGILEVPTTDDPANPQKL